MRILYCALKYDYGIPSRGFSYEHENFYHTLFSMSNLDVTYFPFDEIMRRVGRRALNQELLERVERLSPDLCFFVLFTDEITQDTIREITRRGQTLTFNWFSDDQWRFESYSKHWATLFHWVSTTDKRAIEKYRTLGYDTVIPTQWACSSRILREHRGMDSKYEVTFVGQPHSNRRKTVTELKRRGLNVECWGHGWPRGRVSQDEMVQIFQQSRINLNFPASSTHLGWKPIVKIFVRRRANDEMRLNRPAEFIDQFKALVGPRRLQIKARNFEIPGAGGFLLTGPAENLEEYYLPGKEIETFNSFDDLVEKLEYYLSHDQQRESIRVAGHARTRSEHTYEKRFLEIFRTMGLLS